MKYVWSNVQVLQLNELVSDQYFIGLGFVQHRYSSVFLQLQWHWKKVHDLSLNLWSCDCESGMHLQWSHGHYLKPLHLASSKQSQLGSWQEVTSWSHVMLCLTTMGVHLMTAQKWCHKWGVVTYFTLWSCYLVTTR